MDRRKSRPACEYQGRLYREIGVLFFILRLLCVVFAFENLPKFRTNLSGIFTVYNLINFTYMYTPEMITAFPHSR